jgi:UDP-2-acetamido-3-amino-2,3-dideoxy-glucuronate N-acetyltransferase
MVGVPAKQVGWMSEYGEQIPLPTHGEGIYTCPHTGQIYILVKDQLKRQVL